MIHYTDIAFTAYAVTKMARARRFYEKTMGLKPTRVLSKNFVEYDIGSGTLVVACSPKMWPPSRKGTSAALEVKDFPAAVEHLRKKKVKFAIKAALSDDEKLTDTILELVKHQPDY